MVVTFNGFFFSRLQQFGEFGTDLDLILTLHLGQFFNRRIGGLHQAIDADTSPLQQRTRPVVLAQHRRQQVGGLNIAVVIAERERLSVAQSFLELGGELVLSHICFL